MKQGQIESIGQNRLAVANLARDTDVIDAMFTGVPPADYMYTDPPWGTRLIRSFNTMNKKMTGDEGVDIEHHQFLDALLEVATKHVTHGVVLEYGVEQHDEVVQWGGDIFTHVGTIDVIYKAAKKIMHQHYFERTPDAFDTGKMLDAIESAGQASVGFALDAMNFKEGEQAIVYDPCCGFGNFAKVAKQKGFTFYGSEMNGERLQRCFDWMSK